MIHLATLVFMITYAMRKRMHTVTIKPSLSAFVRHANRSHAMLVDISWHKPNHFSEFGVLLLLFPGRPRTQPTQIMVAAQTDSRHGFGADADHDTNTPARISLLLIKLIPLLGIHAIATNEAPVWLAAGQAISVVLGIILAGYFLLPPIMRIIAKTGINELLN